MTELVGLHAMPH